MIDLNIMDKIQKITEIGLSKKELQSHINVIEVFYAWDVLVNKYDIMETINVIECFIEDKELALIVTYVKEILIDGISSMESIIEQYSIPFFIRPPENSNTSIDIEYFTDRYIFRNLHEAIQSFFPTLGTGYMQSTSPKIKKEFKNHLMLTMKLHEKLVEYGKLKGFLDEPPIYRP